MTLFKFLVDLQLCQCEIGGVFEQCSCGLHSCLDILNPNHHINKLSGPFILITIGKVFQIESIESTLEKQINFRSISSNNVFPSHEESSNHYWRNHGLSFKMISRVLEWNCKEGYFGVVKWKWKEGEFGVLRENGKRETWMC